MAPPPPPPSLASQLLSALSPSSILTYVLFSAFIALHVGYQVYLLLLRLVTWKATEAGHLEILSALRAASASDDDDDDDAERGKPKGLTNTQIKLPGSARLASYRIPSHLALVLAPPPQARLRHLLVPPVLSAANAAASSSPTDSSCTSADQGRRRRRRQDADLIVQLRELIRWSAMLRIGTLSALDPQGRLKELLGERFGRGRGEGSSEWIIEWESSESEALVKGGNQARTHSTDDGKGRSAILKRPIFQRSTAVQVDSLPSSTETAGEDVEEGEGEDEEEEEDEGNEDADIFMTPSLDSVTSFHTPLLDPAISRSVSSLRASATDLDGADEEEEEGDEESRSTATSSSSSSGTSSRGSAESLLIKEGSTGERVGRGRQETEKGLQSPMSNSATSPASSRSVSRSRGEGDDGKGIAVAQGEDKRREGAAALSWESFKASQRWLGQPASGFPTSEAAKGEEGGRRTRWRVRARLHFPPSSSRSSSSATAAASTSTSQYHQHHHHQERGGAAAVALPPVEEELTIDVWLFGPEDGKEMLRSAGQSMLDERRTGGACKMDVGAVDRRLRDLSHLPMTDPELLILHGGLRDVQSLSTFPAWPLRLTEIFYDDEADMRRGLGLRSFLGALRSFARAEQRFGK